MIMSHPYRPSYPITFNVPPDQRPFFDFTMVRTAERPLPIHLRKLNTGVTRWGNFVVGMALEAEASAGNNVDVVAEWAATGMPLQFIIQIEMAESDPRAPIPTRFGSVSVNRERAAVSGGDTSSGIDTVIFQRAGDLFVPVSTTTDDVETVRANMDLPAGFGERMLHYAGSDIPQELRTAYDFGEMEDAITSVLTDGLGTLIVSGSVWPALRG